jgi:hypothetical protein
MKLSNSTWSGDIEEGEIVILEDHTVQFEKILDNLTRHQKACRRIPRDDVIPLAQLLVNRGCRVHSALWIAIKFAGVHASTPDADLMALGAKMTISGLVRDEAEDLRRVDWNLAPLARACGLMD